MIVPKAAASGIPFPTFRLTPIATPMVLSIKVTPEATADNPADLPNSAPSTAGMTTKVVKGSLWTLAGQVAPLAVSLITTPFVIRMLGAESYGVLILVGLIPTYLGFADFGMGLASTKFASEAYAEGNPAKEARIVRTAAFIALCSSIPIGLVLFSFSGSIVSFFSVPEHLHGEASLALKFAAVTFVLNLLNGILNTPQLTRLRMDLNTLINAAFRIVGLIAVPIAIYLGFGILGAILVLMLSALLTLAGHIFASSRLLPHLINLTLEIGTVRSLIKFGIAWVWATIAGMVLINAEKGILAGFASVEALAYYSVAFTLAGMMTMFSGAMTQSLIPAFSQLQRPGFESQFNSLYGRGIRFTVIWLVPTLVFLMLIAEPFISFWAGPHFASQSVTPFHILQVGLVFNVLAYFPHAAITSTGRTDIFAKLYWLELAPYLLMLWYLTARFGIIGAAAAWSLRVIADALIFFILGKRVAGVSLQIGNVTPLVIAAGSSLFPIAVYLICEKITVIVLASAGIWACAYAFLVWKFVLFTEEIDWISSQMHSLSSK